MPSRSRRSSTVDGMYDWEMPEQDHKKKSRSRVPAEEKLVKRRDQNRVSQRAFRQRKEKHTKELEAKVEELEILLETASFQNSLVTSQMSRMEEELRHYRRLLFSDASSSSRQEAGLSVSMSISPPPSEASTPANSSSSSASSYAIYKTAPAPAATSYPASYALPTSNAYANSPRSIGSASSSAHSSPALTSLPGDFAAAGAADPVAASFWSYGVPSSHADPGYVLFNNPSACSSSAARASTTWQGQGAAW